MQSSKAMSMIHYRKRLSFYKFITFFKSKHFTTISLCYMTKKNTVNWNQLLQYKEELYKVFKEKSFRSSRRWKKVFDQIQFIT